MITVREFRNLINSHGTDFNIQFQKLAHNPKGFELVSLIIVDLELDEFENKHKFLLKETYNKEHSMNDFIPLLRNFCDIHDDMSLIDFQLLTDDEEEIPLLVMAGDVSWSEKIFTIDFEEQ